jgi:hypothetical protein
LEKREDRRDRSWRYAARARRIHLARVHPTGALDCVCEQSVWYFRKRKALGCACRHRKHGAPKLGTGICYLGDRPAVRRRIQGRRLTRAWLSVSDVVDAEL